MAEYWAGLAIWKWRMRRRLEKEGAIGRENAKKPEELNISMDTLKSSENGG